MISLALGILLAQAPRFPLVDEGAADKQFSTFRSNMLRAIAVGNNEYIESRITDDIKWSFGVENGKQSFLQHWNESPEGWDGFLRELKLVLSLGGGFQHGGFWAPYTHAFWPDVSEEDYNAVAVRLDARVYEAPRDDAQAIARLNYEMVKIEYPTDGTTPPPGWTPIMHNGKQAWMRDRDVRTPYSYRAGFEKQNGSYYMTVFIAGD